MKKYRVVISYGKSKAPSIIVEAEGEKEAVEIARQQSALGRFSQWSFIPREIKNR